MSRHLHEIAIESGIDIDALSVTTHHQRHRIAGIACESWYFEDGCYWHATTSEGRIISAISPYDRDYALECLGHRITAASGIPDTSH